jgi:hypothetical protein
MQKEGICKSWGFTRSSRPCLSPHPQVYLPKPTLTNHSPLSTMRRATKARVTIHRRMAMLILSWCGLS